MAKIPFTLEAWLKDKSQRVETRDGRIVHDIWEVKNAVTAKEYRTEVCALIEGEEDALVFFKNGKYLPVNAESPFDLFIITPEPELTRFEQEVRECVTENLTVHINDVDGREMSSTVFIDDDTAKKLAAELLKLAREELVKQGYVIEKKLFHDAVEKIDDRHKAEMCVEYSLHCKVENGTRHAVMNWNEFQKIAQHFIDCGKAEALKEIEQDPESSYAFHRGVEYGKEEALNDLPRWKKATGKERFNERMIVLAGDNDLLCTNYAEEGEYYISFSELEKLPKED